MKIILSRKGFDSSSGGVPSPIFPDGKILSLPIPDKNSKIPYNSILWNKTNIGNIVEDLTKGKQRADFFAHLDPDLNKSSMNRKKNWLPLFGQENAAQGHLRNQGVGKGDLFLFFGLFRDVIIKNNKTMFVPKSSQKHIIWGWFQIDNILKIDDIDPTKYPWATYHPHFHKSSHNTNMLYFAKKHLNIPGIRNQKISGAGIFQKFSKKLQLTADNSKSSLWKLPKWMFPENGRTPLTYNKQMEKWEKKKNHSLLQAAKRGQEFVLDCNYYPEATEWIKNLLIE